MPIQVLMPALSPTMEKGNLAKWLKKEGDTVKSGDVIAEIETDKATMEVEAVDEGTLGKILVPEGTEDVAVNTPIATILAEGEDEVGAGERSAKPATPQQRKPAGSPRRRAAAAEAEARRRRPRQQPKSAVAAPPQAGGLCPIPTFRQAPRWSP